MKPRDYFDAGVITQSELEVLDLRYLHNFSWRQIALALDLHRSTAKSRHDAGLQKVARYERRQAA